MSAHTLGRITIRPEGDANNWSMLTEDGRWWLALLANGEQLTDRQMANFRRLAAAWNACNGISTEALEAGAVGDLLQAAMDGLVYVEDVLADPSQLAQFKPGAVQRHAASIKAAIAKTARSAS